MRVASIMLAVVLISAMGGSANADNSQKNPNFQNGKAFVRTETSPPLDGIIVPTPVPGCFPRGYLPKGQDPKTDTVPSDEENGTYTAVTQHILLPRTPHKNRPSHIVITLVGAGGGGGAGSMSTDPSQDGGGGGGGGAIVIVNADYYSGDFLDVTLGCGGRGGNNGNNPELRNGDEGGTTTVVLRHGNKTKPWSAGGGQGGIGGVTRSGSVPNTTPGKGGVGGGISTDNDATNYVGGIGGDGGRDGTQPAAGGESGQPIGRGGYAGANHTSEHWGAGGGGGASFAYGGCGATYEMRPSNQTNGCNNLSAIAQRGIYGGGGGGGRSLGAPGNQGEYFGRRGGDGVVIVKLQP